MGGDDPIRHRRPNNNLPPLPRGRQSFQNARRRRLAAPVPSRPRKAIEVDFGRLASRHPVGTVLSRQFNCANPKISLVSRRLWTAKVANDEQ